MRRIQVALVVSLAVLMVVPAMGQEFYSPTPTAVAQPARNLLKGLPVQVVVRVAGPYVYMYGDFKSNTEHYVTVNGGTVDYLQSANIVEVVIGDFQPTSTQGISANKGRLAIATSGVTNATTGTVRLVVRGQIVHSVQFEGKDIARGITIAYGKGGGAQAQLPATGYYGGQGYGGFAPATFGQGGVALDATGQAGVYGPNGQFQSGQTYGNAMPMGYGGYQPTYAPSGATTSSLNPAGYYTPDGQWIQPGANGAAINGSAGAPQGNGNIAIYNQQFPNAEKAIRKALEPAVKKLAQGR